MTLFSKIALPLAERGFRVFPLVPNSKRPLAIFGEFDHFDAATTEASQIELWSQQAPDANVGMSPDEIFCFLETDDEAALKTACADLPPEVWETARVSARDNRCYYIFRQTMRTKRAGNMAATREGKENLFEFKQHRMYVTGPGSIHPKTGKPYDAQWGTIPAMPDILLNRLCELYGKPKAAQKQEMSEEVQRETALLDSFLETYEVATTGEWFNKGKQWFRPIECPWAASHENDSGASSTCVVFTEGGGYGFDCKHRCEQKGWKDFRAEMERQFPERAFSFVANNSPSVVLGTSDPELAKLPKRVRPTYPMSAWDGTVIAEFAKLCANDNNVPQKLYAEAFRCVLGAVVGDRVSCPDVEGALPRTYTIIVAPKGKGKGTAIRRAQQFFSRPYDGEHSTSTKGGGLRVSFSDPLLSGNRDFMWKAKGIGAYEAAASSVPGLAKLIKEPDESAKNKPQFTWGNTKPRILSVHEEMKTFLSALFIEGGVGSGLEGVVCQLWDDVVFHGTATGTREAQFGELMFSMLCGVTEEDWFDLLSRGNAVGGGLLSRLNIIGTEGGYLNVSKMKPPDFAELQETFLPRVVQLQDAHMRIKPSADAERIICEWADNLPEGSERINIHAWRSALLIAWLRCEGSISARTAEDAVKLGQYQISSHEYYRPKTADTANARVQGKILRALEMRGLLSKRGLQRATHADRDGTELWNRALSGLLSDGSIGKRQDGKFYRAE